MPFEKRAAPARSAPQRGKPGPKKPAGPKKPPPPPGLSPRRAALDILNLVSGGRSLDEALEACRSFNALDGPDRGLAHALAAIVLRRGGAFDHAIGLYIDKPLPKSAAKAHEILRLVAAQSLILKTPDHAAVSTAVALANEFRETAGYAGLVNAVARKIAALDGEFLEKLPERIDTPGWMWRAWERAYGAETARAIARAHHVEAPLDITLKDPSEAPAFASETGGPLLTTGSVRLAAGTDVASLPGYAEGRFWVQDAAAALPARLFSNLAGKTAIDLCAAPGGKTMQLAAAGASVLAVDIAGLRLKTVAENLARTGLTAKTIKADIREWTPEEQADAVLLDAPCTATGTIRRHPDVLRSKSEESVKTLSAMQAGLIDRAVAMAKTGGEIVYCVCSLQPEEGEKQIEAALHRIPGLLRRPIEPAEIGLPGAVTRNGDLRTLPSMLAGEGGIDGFFAARLIRS
jgi:16S rRNA (cytosine967-C5)-methyltransferase